MIRPHPRDGNLLFVTPVGAHKDAPPLYTISKNPSNPTFVTYRGPLASENTVAMASLHLSTSKVDLSVCGQSLTIKNNPLSGSWSFETYMGKFKWKVNQLTETGFELHNQMGRKVAKYGSAGLTRLTEKQLAIYEPGNEFFIVMVLLSAVASKELAKIIDGVVGEVVGAVAGV
jgi:hypothetical protein